MTTTSDREGEMPSDPDQPRPDELGLDDLFPAEPAGGQPVAVQPLEETQPVLLPPRPPRAEPPAAPSTPAVDLTPSAEASAAHASREQPTVIMTPYGELPAYNADDVLPSGAPGKGSRPARAPKGAGPGDGEGPRPRRTGPTPLGRAVLPLGLALVSGVALVAGWTHLQEDRANDTAAPPVTLPAASSTPTAGAATSSTPVASESPSAVASATPKPVASSSAAPSATSSARPVDRSVPVVVLNSTARTGLAAKVAASLRKDGWKVVSVGNYRGGRLALTTVFAQGNADAVATMRADLPTKDAVKAPVGAMNPDRLTVVIGADYPRS
jgi:hypothetical protein